MLQLQSENGSGLTTGALQVFAGPASPCHLLPLTQRAANQVLALKFSAWSHVTSVHLHSARPSHKARSAVRIREMGSFPRSSG